MSEEASLITQFREVTGVDEQRAQFFLESAGWQIDVRSQNSIAKWVLIKIYLGCSSQLF